jgi:lipopolysaccharide biosynthesis glycosyltransferase
MSCEWNPLTDEQMKTVRKLSSNNVKIYFYVIDYEDCYESRGYWHKDMFCRLFAPEVLPHYKKCLYLDIDTCVIRNLDELFSMDVKYVLGTKNLLDIRHVTYDNLDIGEKYIGSGVLMMNLKNLHKMHFVKKLHSTYKNIQPILHFPDQDMINIICYHVKQAHTTDLYDNVFESQRKVIVHFWFREKPWMKHDTAYAKIWMKYNRNVNVLLKK